jgi:DNA end-binding protein Ku
MAARSIASLTVTFGLVSVPVKLYTATQASGGVHFNLLHGGGCGSRLKQQYVCAKEGTVVERADMVKGYEFAKDQYVIFTPEELKALEEKGSQAIEIVAFVPEASIDPIYYDKAYYLGPDKGGARPYALLGEAMQKTGRCALARWAWKGKQYMVQIRATADGLILQQLLYAEEVRKMTELEIERQDVKDAELKLAIQLIEQIAVDTYDPNAYVDEVKKRVEAAVQQKVEGKEITVGTEAEAGGAQVIDLMEALRASLSKTSTAPAAAASTPAAGARKPAKRVEATEAAAPAKSKGKKTG